MNELNLEEIPASLLIKHPELAQIVQALWEYSNQQMITACCPHCGKHLTVTTIQSIGTTWVTCLQGCTTYREMRKPLE